MKTLLMTIFTVIMFGKTGLICMEDIETMGVNIT